MKSRLLTLAISLLAILSSQAQTNERYIEVTGTAEIEIVPDRIHYLIEIREYFEEEFDGKSKPEEYRTKVPLSEIEQGLREALDKAGIPRNAIRTQEIGDYWRQQGQDFLVSKRFDLSGGGLGQEAGRCHTRRGKGQRQCLSVRAKQRLVIRCRLVRQLPHHQEALFHTRPFRDRGLSVNEGPCRAYVIIISLT